MEEQLVKKDQRTFIYFLVMLIGGVMVIVYLRPYGYDYSSLLYHLAFSFLIQIACVALGLLLMMIRRFFSTRKELLFDKAFWLDTVEEGFSVWFLMVLAMLINYFF